jgi:hypothetical protein
MRVYRFALIALATVVFSAFSARPASADTWQLCLGLSGVSANLYLNFNVQGNAIMVSGTKGVSGDDHGPVFGTLTQVPVSNSYEMGLTVTIANMGDYEGHNTENIVIVFSPTGSMSYKRWLNSSQTFTQGTVFLANCVS